MPNYVIAYHGGKKFESREEGAAYQAKWKAWIGGLGAAVVNPAMPLGKSKIVSAGGVSHGRPDPLTGFSIVKADSIDAAVEMAEGCPHLAHGTLEVAEVMEMK